MRIIPLILCICFIISSCSNKTSDHCSSIPENIQPDWEGFEINSDSPYIKTIVLDFVEDESVYWIGVCFIHKNKLFGRQIFDRTNSKCLDLLDITYIKNEYLNDYKVVKHLTVNKNKIGIGAKSSAVNLKDVIGGFNWGVKQRKKKQTPCNEDLIDMNVVRECYFDIAKIQST